MTPLQIKDRLLRGGAWAFGGKVAAALVFLASNALLARLLTPAELGAYFLAFSVVSLGSQLGALGLGKPMVRFTAESVGLGRYGDARRTIGLALALGLAGAAGVGLAYLLFGQALAEGLFRSPALGAVGGLVAAWIALTALQKIMTEAFRGFHDIRLAVLFEGGLGLVTGVLFAGCLGLLWLLAGAAALGTVVALAAICAGTSVLAAAWLLRWRVSGLPHEEGGEGGRLGLGDVWGLAWPSLVTNFTLFALTQADLWVLGAFRPQGEVAIYGAAAKTVVLVAMPLLVVNSVVPPLIAQMYAQGRRGELERALRAVATAVGIPAFGVMLAFVLAGGPLLGLLYGEVYREGALVLTLLSLGQLSNVWAGSCGQVLTMTGHHWLLLAITALCGGLTVAAGVLLVGPFGATGIAAAAASGLVLQNVAMWLGTRIKTGMWTHAGMGGITVLRKALAR